MVRFSDSQNRFEYGFLFWFWNSLNDLVLTTFYFKESEESTTTKSLTGKFTNCYSVTSHFTHGFMVKGSFDFSSVKILTLILKTIRFDGFWVWFLKNHYLKKIRFWKFQNKFIGDFRFWNSESKKGKRNGRNGKEGWISVLRSTDSQDEPNANLTPVHACRMKL